MPPSRQRKYPRHQQLPPQIHGREFHESHDSREEFPRRYCKSRRDARAPEPSHGATSALGLPFGLARHFARGTRTLFSGDRSLQSGGKRSNQVRFLVLKDRSKVNHDVIIFDARDDGNSSAATKTPSQIGGRMAFAANVKDGTAKALRWSGAAARQRFTRGQFDF